MNKVIIHVGLHKTASTFLQNRVWPKIAGYTLISRPYTQHNTAFNKLQFADDSLYDEAETRREIELFGTSNLILSDEAFSGKPIYFSYINRTLIAKRLQSLYPNAEIIVFLRDQKDIVRSHYSSYVRMPFGTKAIEEFFYKSSTGLAYDEYLENPDQWIARQLYYNTNDFYMHLDCFKYSHLVKLYQNLFTNCHFFLYEDLTSRPEIIYSKLSDILGVKVSGEGLSRENQALSTRQLEKKRRENRLLLLTKNRFLAKSVRTINTLFPVKANYDVKTTVDRLIQNYYSDDNTELKCMLSHFDWSKYPNKYN